MMKKLCTSIISCITLTSLVFGGSVLAATDTFLVSQTVVSDASPPTAPGNFTASPVATTQVNLSWDASTDNIGVTGYRVYRDDTVIATTTLLLYSDTGLVPATTYSYYATAFDAAGNFSASSTEIATTTLASTTPPATTTPASSGGGGRVELQQLPLEIVWLTVTPGQTSTRIEWETRGHVRSIVRWGETSSYELGSLSERSFRTFHETTITGLAPGTTYHFTIEGENSVGVFGVLTQDVFRTLALDDNVPPANVSNLTAWREGTDIVLSFAHPLDPDFAYARVMRNSVFYPGDTADGWLVYEGTDEYVRDEGVALPGSTQYYTVFSYDAHGNISSGAVVALSIPKAGDVPAIRVPPVPAPVNLIDLSFSDLIFEQEGQRLPVTDDTVSIKGSKQLIIKLPYDRSPEHLKAILVSMAHADDHDAVFSFLLRADAAKEWYTATLAPLGKAGSFPVMVNVYDFKAVAVSSAEGTISSTIVRFERDEGQEFGIGSYMRWIVLGIAVILLLLVFVLYLRSARRDAQYA